MKRVRFQGDSSEVRDAKFSSKTYKRRPSAMKLARLGTESVVFRYQAIKSDDQYAGYHSLEWGNPAVGSNIPMHIYNLSIVPNSGVGYHSGAAGLMQGWSNTTAAADRQIWTLFGQSPAGANVASAPWYPEVNGPVLYGEVSKAMHKWTSIKMQLYGALNDDVKFTVSLVKYKDDFANPWFGGVTNEVGKTLQDSMINPYLASRISTTNSRAVPQMVKILKEWTVVVPRMSDDIGTTQDNVNSRELNIFVRHNWINDYNWPNASTASINPHTNEGNLGFGIDYNKHTSPLPGKTLFLVVRGTCPKQGEGPPSNKQYSGTYNIVMRNAFTIPT